MKIEPTVTNVESGSWLDIVKNASLYFSGGFLQQGGGFLSRQGHVKVGPNKFKVTGGALVVAGEDTQYTGSFDGDLEFSGDTDLLVGLGTEPDGAQTKFGTMQVTGTLKIDDGVRVRLTVDVSQGERGDFIQVNGTANLTITTVIIKLVNNSSDLWQSISGRHWTYFSATTLNGYPWGVSPSIQGTEYLTVPTPNVHRDDYSAATTYGFIYVDDS